jgi:hypothetical protein
MEISSIKGDGWVEFDTLFLKFSKGEMKFCFLEVILFSNERDKALRVEFNAPEGEKTVSLFAESALCLWGEYSLPLLLRFNRGVELVADSTLIEYLKLH